MSERPLRVAVAGCGFFARFHFDGWARIPGVELVGACDLDRQRAEVFAREFGIAQVFTSPEDMLDATKPDIFDIATPPDTHAAMVRLGLAHAPTVICQKAFCRTLEEARATAALADDAPDRLIVHENFRFEPWYRKIRDLIDADTFGDIYQATFRLRPGDGQGAKAYLARQPYFQKMPRFLMRETGIHFIDTFRFLLGEVEAVYADLRRLNPAISGEDAGHVVFSFAGGRRALFDANRLADHVAVDRRKTMGEFWLEGSRASIRLDGFGRLFLRDHGANDEREVAFAWEDRGYGGDCVHLFQRHVVSHAIFRTGLETRAKDYLRNLEIEEKIYQSSAEGRQLAIGQASGSVLEI
jgi:predicted dehydrogenase